MRLAFAVLCFLPPLLAQAAGTTFAERWTRADSDNSGTLSRTEARDGFKRLHDAFDAIDADRNGELSAAEVRAWRAAGKRNTRSQRPSGFAEQFAAGDADRDGVLTRAEAGSRLPRVAANFDAIDTDRDGRISREELRAWIDKRRAAKTLKARRAIERSSQNNREIPVSASDSRIVVVNGR